MVEFEMSGDALDRIKAANELVEGAWRAYRRRMGAAIDDAFKIQDEIVEELGLERLPPEIALLAASAGLIIREHTVVDLQDPQSVATYKLNFQSLACWAAWRESKTLYCIEPALAQCLSSSPWPDQTPVEALLLPSRFPVLVFPRSNENHQPVVIGVRYDLEQDQEGRKALELRFNLLQATTAPAWIEVAVLRLTGHVLGECFEAYLASLPKTGSRPNEVRSAVREHPFIRLATTTLLYLGGEPEVVRLAHPGEKPAVKDSLRTCDPLRWHDLRDPSIQTVGHNFQRVIERWELEQKSESGEATGQFVRPHVRRAHSHLYRTGAGRRIPRVRFLLPIPVKGASIPDERETTSKGRVI